MRTHLAVLLLAGLAGCAAPGDVVAPVPDAGSQFAALSTLPSPLGGIYERRGPTAPDHTSGVVSGAMLPLSAPDSFATVYLFRRTPSAVPEGVGSREVADELAQSTISMIARVTSETGTSPAPRPVGVSAAQGGAETVRCIAIAVPVATGLRGDAVCVGGVGGNLLKVRTTVLLRGIQAGEAAAATMLTATAAAALAADIRTRLSGADPDPAALAPGLRT